MVLCEIFTALFFRLFKAFFNYNFINLFWDKNCIWEFYLAPFLVAFSFENGGFCGGRGRKEEGKKVWDRVLESTLRKKLLVCQASG